MSNIINVSSRIVLCVTHRGTSKNSGHITVYADSFYSSLTRDTPPYKEGSSEKKKKWSCWLWKLPHVWPHEHFDTAHPTPGWPCCGRSSVNHTPLSRLSRPGGDDGRLGHSIWAYQGTWPLTCRVESRNHGSESSPSATYVKRHFDTPDVMWHLPVTAVLYQVESRQRLKQSSNEWKEEFKTDFFFLLFFIL